MAVRKRVKGTGQPSPRRAGRFPTGVFPFLLLAAATGAIYANSLHNEFLFDDLKLIREERAGFGEGAFWQLRALLSTGRAYRPIRTASYAFDYAISGLDPWGYHLSNITYHALSACFVFLIAQHLLRDRRIALFTALLFAVHPIQTDAVTYISGRRDVLSGLFVIAGFYAFLRFRESNRAGYLLLALALCPIAFFTKESGIVLPFLIVAYDLVCGTRVSVSVFSRQFPVQLWAGVTQTVRRRPLLYLGLLACAAALASYVIFVTRGTALRAYHGGSLWFTLLTDTRIFVHYLTLLLFPVTLNADYSYNAFPVTTTWTDPRALAATVGLVAVAIWLLSLLKDRPIATFGGLWFFIGLVPVAHIIPHHEMVAEHYLYVPSVGFCLLVGALLLPLVGRPAFTRTVYAVGSVVLVVLALRTVWRNRDWKNDLSLWTETVRVAPQAARARNNLGAAYLRRGQLDLAREQLEAALLIKPDSPIARGNLGKVYFDLGDLTSAERELEAALRLQRREVIPRLWLGGVYVQEGRTTDAEEAFRAVLRRDSRNGFAYNNLGVLLMKTGRVAEGEEAFRSAIRVQPDFREAQENLIRLYLRQGRLAEAEAAIQAGLLSWPNDPTLRHFLGLLRRNQREEGRAGWGQRVAVGFDGGSGAARTARDRLRDGVPR